MPVTKKGGLNLLAAFLNYRFGDDGEREAKHPFTNRWPVRFDNQKLRTLQKQLTEAVEPIASYGQQGQPKTDELEHNLKRLVDQINKLNFKTRYEVVSGPSISWLPTLKFSGSRFHLMRMSLADVDQPHLELYEIILDSMIRGSFDRLRRCRKCKLFFVAGKAGADYCRDKCRADFHNSTASERVKRWRDKARKKKLRNAKELAEKGWSIYRISEQIGLSERILRRAKIQAACCIVFVFLSVSSAVAVTGNAWKQLSETQRGSYVMGVIDGWDFVSALAQLQRGAKPTETEEVIPGFLIVYMINVCHTAR